MSDTYSSLATLITARQTVLQTWYDNYGGRAALHQLTLPIQDMTADVFGYYALEFGVLAGHQTFLQDSRIQGRFKGGVSVPPHPNLDFVATPDALPLTFGALDLLVASHVLELTDNPHHVLREIERVLMPEGHCVLIGFNPWSLRGLAYWQQRWGWGKHKASQPVYYSPWRVKDWFELLGFEVLKLQLLHYRPNIGGMRLWYSTRWMDAIGQRFKLPTGSLYIIHARKKVSMLTPVEGKRQHALRPLLQPVGGIAINSSSTREVPYE